MHSQHYADSVKLNTQFQENNKKWAGKSVGGYASYIRDVVKEHNALTLLDYGCGKGIQYICLNKYKGSDIAQTFDQYLGVSDVYKYDPCVSSYSQPPDSDQTFDAVILTQVLPFIPDDDIKWVKELLMSYTNKFCFIGNYDPVRPVKDAKQALMNPEHFRVNRTMDWYYDQFADWSGSALYWNFKVDENTRVFKRSH